MTTRASWRGFLTIEALSCPVALYTAVSSADRLSFNIINRKTGHRVERQFVDSETGKPVSRDDQVKGYRLEQGDYIMIEDDEIASITPHGDKTLTVESFIDSDDIDKLFFERPYYLAAGPGEGDEVLALIAEAMRARKVTALARAVLFRRYRTMLIRPHEDGLIATLLNFDYEVRSAKEAFKAIPDLKITDEMLDLAGHIIGTKQGEFNPAAYEDRYEAALVELVKAKIEGKPLPKGKPAKEEKVVDLLQALRESAGLGGKGKGGAPKGKPAGAQRQRKAG
ncbi:Ku protein [Rhizobium sp. BK376]|uniref:non-homologous end joining protein Ku n=1 Tax=Rhizobium sp. BK376 TaxID=2512149 RepID=UPI00104B17F0|nr:Ku protein [Rhizobium sp. BK376]TCR82431.1 DNA end-binding protein Ku [Rhizobium sp. BK376]